MLLLSETKAELIERVLDHARSKLPQDTATQIETFVREYYRWADPEDLVERSPLDIYGAAMAHWHLAQHRLPHERKVHVYAPQVEEHGWQSPHTVIEIVTDDMPFLVDSVTMEINRHEYAIHFAIHPVMKVRRDTEGRLREVMALDAAPADAITESFIHVEVDRQREPAALDELRQDLCGVLADVYAVVDDWPGMREAIQRIAHELAENPPPIDYTEIAEARSLLEWLRDGNFIFLGYREYDLLTEGGEDVLRVVPGSGLGILRETGMQPAAHSFSRLPAEARALARSGNLLVLTKANSRATVHRPAHMDYVGIKRFDSSGQVTGERRFLGLYTTAAYNAHPRDIPVLRRTFNHILDRAAFPPGGHYYKALIDILETYPKDELFQIAEDELFAIAMGILHLGEHPRVRLFLRRDTYGRFMSCLVYLPRELYNTENLNRIQAILQQKLHGVSVEHTERVAESVLARSHFILRYTDPGDIPDYDVREIEARLVEATRSWADDLHAALIDQCGEEMGNQLFRRYREAFPAGYRAEFPARNAVPDIKRMEEFDPAGDLGMSLYRPLEAPERVLRFKVFRCGQPIALSDVLPVLESLGVKVVDERPYEISPSARPPVWIYDFGLVYAEDGELETDYVKEIFQDAFAQAWRGAVETDGFNRLVLQARLTWREVTVLRAYTRYLRQTGSTFSQVYIEQSLTGNPHIARLLIELFRARFNPTGGKSAAEQTALVTEIEQALDAVPSLDEDRILRSFLSLIRATLRTNYFQLVPREVSAAGSRAAASAQPKPYLSFKFDPALVPDLPLPRPMFEIFVYSPSMEGVHLRGGSVARGGIRWSDRREDFRTEILGLMKAQMVKNAVIVPVGAKGGFVVKRPPADRGALMDEVKTCYQTLIRGMLDLTDNLVGEKVVPPADVVRCDGDDPYLVVAADKGTATFSDIANALAREYGFWLGDAFASGGSAGYDHKEMGITSRGAWESVKRHFRELGMDPETTDFTVIGIGDMSGDVFGNGMLLSRHIELVGAFNHQHIFLDPNPDPDKSFAERRRLFELPRSSWADYDQSLISAGGGIYPRTAKSIPLSAEVRQRLAIEAEALPPNELIRALLKAPIDLLWNGGIGTYVKASDESHSDAADRANDAVRVDASELRCRVVAEGGNLGFTQSGRIEYALRGGKINTDAIDNSAGVDCSDHEVNIKILLDAIVAAGDMTEKQRNQLLASMTDEVAALVLRDNYEQNQALSVAEAQAPAMLDVHARFIRSLEQADKLNREIEFLPDDERIAQRRTAHRGLVCPELATLLAYSKITLYAGLLAADLPDAPYLHSELVDYFPTPLRERAGEQMQRHRLRREIIATRVANGIVNWMGSTFVYQMAEETGATAADIARAFTAAREVFDARSLWSGIEALDNQIARETQITMISRTAKLIERATRWLVRNRRPPLDIPATIAHFAPGVAALAQGLPNLLVNTDHDEIAQAAADFTGKGVPTTLALRVASLGMLFPALDIVEVASAIGLPVETVAGVYFALGTRLRLHWLRDQILALPLGNRWQSLARASLRDDFYSLHSVLTAEVLRTGPPELDAQGHIAMWVDENSALVERWLQMLSDIKSGQSYDLATLSVALHGMRNLIHPSARGPARRL
jgi:glutamate dehydrogenase